uniref:Ig-like domain-containing protein n=1 Tax=Echeneis naucrates TaxID=173247 RepID=A0A665VV20_ECHNA
CICNLPSPSEVKHFNSMLLLRSNTRHGPVFTQEPSDSIFPLSTDDKQVFINCKAKGNPPPHYRWKVDGRDLNMESEPNYSLVEGNLLINNPHVINHGGVYQCIATNTFGTVVSREAKVQFACESIMYVHIIIITL